MPEQQQASNGPEVSRRTLIAAVSLLLALISAGSVSAMTYYGGRFERQEREQQKLRAALAEVEQAQAAPTLLAPTPKSAGTKPARRQPSTAVLGSETDAVTGAVGSNGAQGHNGDDGAVGVRGADGVPGTDGAPGTDGVPGTSEVPDAVSAPDGAKGDKGDAGAQGVQGATGLKGDKGDTGDTGAQGLQGIQGDQGAQGGQGIQGAAGPKGDTGDTGAQGLQGDTGAQGLQGIQGNQGLQGPQGIQGTAGLKGDTGDTGAQGPQGIQGATGLKGDKGDTGAAGADGLAAPVDTDSTMAANSDSLVPSQKAVKTALAGKAPASIGAPRPFIVPSGEWWLTTAGLATTYGGGTPSSNAVNSNNYVRFTPFYLSEDTLVDGMAIFIVTANAGASAAVGLAIYDANPTTGKPRNVIVDAGTSSINTTGVKTLTFTAVTLTPGYYWAAVSTRNLDTAGTNPQFAVGTGNQAASETTPAASNNMFPYYGGTSASWPVANPTASIIRSTTSSLPHIWLRKG